MESLEQPGDHARKQAVHDENETSDNAVLDGRLLLLLLLLLLRELDVTREAHGQTI